MRVRTYLVGGLAVFAVLSGIDLAQTYALIGGGGGEVYEANPVAARWLERHGWIGLAAFKAGAVAVFVGAVTVLAGHRPRTAAGLVGLACLVALLVAARSDQLLTAQR